MKVDVANILQGKRKGASLADDKIEPSKKKARDKSMRAKFGLKPGDVVSVAPEVFDGKVPGSYSKQNPKC
jgi:transcription antitermination factor NusG